MRMKEKDEFIKLLEDVVGDYPMNQDEMGGCVWCGGSGKEGSYGYCDESYDCHWDDCAWVAGHKKLVELRNSLST